MMSSEQFFDSVFESTRENIIEHISNQVETKAISLFEHFKATKTPVYLSAEYNTVCQKTIYAIAKDALDGRTIRLVKSSWEHPDYHNHEGDPRITPRRYDKNDTYGDIMAYDGDYDLSYTNLFSGNDDKYQIIIKVRPSYNSFLRGYDRAPFYFNSDQCTFVFEAIDDSKQEEVVNTYFKNAAIRIIADKLLGRLSDKLSADFTDIILNRLGNGLIDALKDNNTL